jgi:hypothetical protein
MIMIGEFAVGLNFVSLFFPGRQLFSSLVGARALDLLLSANAGMRAHQDALCKLRERVKFE